MKKCRFQKLLRTPCFTMKQVLVEQFCNIVLHFLSAVTVPRLWLFLLFCSLCVCPDFVQGRECQALSLQLHCMSGKERYQLEDELSFPSASLPVSRFQVGPPPFLIFVPCPSLCVAIANECYVHLFTRPRYQLL